MTHRIGFEAGMPYVKIFLAVPPDDDHVVAAADAAAAAAASAAGMLGQYSSMVVHGTRRDDACSSIPTELWARSLCCTLHQCCYIFACPPQPGNLQQKLSRNVMTMMSKWLLNQ